MRGAGIAIGGKGKGIKLTAALSGMKRSPRARTSLEDIVAVTLFVWSVCEDLMFGGSSLSLKLELQEHGKRITWMRMSAHRSCTVVRYPKTPHNAAPTRAPIWELASTRKEGAVAKQSVGPL